MTTARPVVRRVTLHRLRIPLRQVYVSAMYLMSDVFRTIIEVETDDGRVGIGEAPGSEDILQVLSQVARSIIGTSPLDRMRLQYTFAASVFNNRNGRNGWSAYGGIELALWDWAGHHLGQPVSALIGQSPRTSIAVVCPVPAIMLERVADGQNLATLFRDRRRIGAVVDYCVGQRQALGFTCFKYKSAGLDPTWDAEVMTALRDALGPGVGLRWDPNAAYSIADATALCGRMDGLALEFYEDPTDDISGMAALRSRVRTPLATNMCVVQLDHLASAIRRRPADVLLVDVYMWGGIHNYLTMAATARAFDFEIGVHSLFETGVGTAVNLHLAAALNEVRHANDCGLHVLTRDVVTPGTLDIEEGRMVVPAGPGWGVTLDRAALADLAVQCLEITRPAA